MSLAVPLPVVSDRRSFVVIIGVDPHKRTHTASALEPGTHRVLAGCDGDRDGEDGARTQRIVVCHNPEAAERDTAVRTNLVAYLTQLIDGSDAWTPR